jgi:hypothetical protein
MCMVALITRCVVSYVATVVVPSPFVLVFQTPLDGNTHSTLGADGPRHVTLAYLGLLFELGCDPLQNIWEWHLCPLRA